MEGLNQLLEESGLDLDEASLIIQEYLQNHTSQERYA